LTARVTVTINGRHYQIACDDGQESHLVRLSEYVNKRVAQLVTAVGQAGDAQLLVMASLLVADELMDAQALAGPQNGGPRRSVGPAPQLTVEDPKLIENLLSLSERIESLADRLERT
jgi:cell division protein ZapA